MPEPSKHRSPFKVVAVILMYWSVSISMVFILKHLLSGHYGNQDFTIFISWYQNCVTVVLILLAGFVSKLLGFKLKVPALDFDTVFDSDMLCLSFTFVGSLTMNNLMLKHINVSFYQVARSFTLISTVGLTACMLRRAVSLKIMFACLLIVCGFFVSVDQEDASGTITVWGVIYGLLASFTSALCGIYFKKGENICGGSSLKLAYVNNFTSMLIFLPLVFSTNQFSHVVRSDVSSNLRFWVFLTLSGVLSLGIGWVSALQIQYTSPVTHHISINAKSVTQTVIAILYYNEHKTMIWWMGNIFVIFGIMLYAFVKIQEDNQTRTSIPSTIKSADSRNPHAVKNLKNGLTSTHVH